MKKILPISTMPIISCYNDESFKYNIVDQYSSYKGWIAMEYIELCMHNDVSLQSSHLKGYHNWPYIIPNLEENKIQRCFFKNYLTDIDIISLIINNICNKTYVYLFLNEYYIPNRYAYKKEKDIHDNLIVGFDTDKSVFYLLGYGISGLIEISEVSFKKFKKSFEQLNETHEKLSDIYFLKPEKCDVSFNIEIFCEKLNKYLSSDNLDEYLDNFSFGISIYNNLYKYYQQILDEYDIRNSQKLLEHKKSLLRSIIFINEFIDTDICILKKPILEIEQLISKCERIKLLTLKYNIYSLKYDKNINDYRRDILDELLTLKNDEERCLKKLLKTLTNYSSESN